MHFGISLLSETRYGHEELVRFVQSLDTEFVPPLSSFVSIPEYCAKLESLGQVYLASRFDTVLGVIAFYCNDMVTYRSYISYCAVRSEGRRLGIGLQLVLAAIEHAQLCSMKEIHVRTWKGNKAALRMYQRAGFLVRAEKLDRADNSMSVHLSRSLVPVDHPQ